MLAKLVLHKVPRKGGIPSTKSSKPVFFLRHNETWNIVSRSCVLLIEKEKCMI